MSTRVHRALAVIASLGCALPAYAERPREPVRHGAAPDAGLPRARIGVVVAPAPTDGGDEGEGHARPGVLSRRAARRLSLGAASLTLTDPARWPGEPKSPDPVVPARLAAALEALCPPTVTPQALREIAEHIVTSALRFEVDPMLLGALMYHQSDCEASRRSSWGTGLTMLNRGLIPASLALGSLRYVRATHDGGRVVQSLPFEPPLSLASLGDPATNLRAAAAMLRMFGDQCAALDAAPDVAPHRHFVSHFIWGDRVRSAAPEDAILTARRRLIDYYLGRASAPPRSVSLGTLLLSSPLDGPPRVVTSGLGAAREGGRRAHAGVDFLSHVGEPVRAVADGVVQHAGSDLESGARVDLPPARAALVPEHAMGVRGLFVELAHDGGYRSIYAHLASYTVAPGDRVTRGQLIGYVGRSGIRTSDPHLHFGLFEGTRVIDPREALATLLFAPLLERTPDAVPQHASSKGREADSLEGIERRP